MKKTDNMGDKNKISYPKLSKIFIILSILFIVWIFFVAIGAFIFEMNPDWAFLNLENWIIIICVFLVIFIIFNIVFYFRYSSKTENNLEFEEFKSEDFLHGKRLYVYTFPEDSEGGIFSKTYISIDDESVLRLRGLIIPPKELWFDNE